MVNGQFDPFKELAVVKEHRSLQRRRQYRKSKLERYRSELVSLYRAGATGQDLATWLRLKHRLKIHRSSISRFLNGLPELMPNQEA